MTFKYLRQFFTLVLLGVTWKSFAEGDVASAPDFHEKSFVPTDEPVVEAKSEDGAMDNERKAFWIILCITILMVLLIVGVIIFWHRHRLVKLFKKKARLQEFKTDLETQDPLQGQNKPLVV